LRLFSFGGYGLALAALALVVFDAIECLPHLLSLLLHQGAATSVAAQRDWKKNGG